MDKGYKYHKYTVN